MLGDVPTNEANELAALTACSRLTGRFQVAQIPEYKPVVAETKTAPCHEQRNSLFGGKPFYSSSFRRWELQTLLTRADSSSPDELIEPLCFFSCQVKGCRDNTR